jgi:basic membrane protein A and related proteins
VTGVHRNRRAHVALLAACVLAGVFTFVGGASAWAGEGAAPRTIRVGLVTDVGPLFDRGFNQLAYTGLVRARKRLNVQTRVLQSRSGADYVPNLTTLTRLRYDLVIGVGFLIADALNDVAVRFPQTKFAIVDVDQQSLKDKPRNVRGLLWREQESGFLVGYLAGLVVRRQGGPQVVSTVGGVKIPPVDRFIAGFQFGAKRANTRVQTLNDYSQDFVDQAKCKELALNQVARGSQVVFAVAGACGLGALDAARERRVWGIGGDADMAYLGRHILTSELKKVDVAVFDTIRDVKRGTFRGGRNKIYTFRNGGAGIGKISPRVPRSIVRQVMAMRARLAAGRIRNIPTTVP